MVIITNQNDVQTELEVINNGFNYRYYGSIRRKKMMNGFNKLARIGEGHRWPNADDPIIRTVV